MYRALSNLLLIIFIAYKLERAKRSIKRTRFQLLILEPQYLNN